MGRPSNPLRVISTLCLPSAGCCGRKTYVLAHIVCLDLTVCSTGLPAMSAGVWRAGQRLQRCDCAPGEQPVWDIRACLLARRWLKLRSVAWLHLPPHDPDHNHPLLFNGLHFDRMWPSTARCAAWLSLPFMLMNPIQYGAFPICFRRMWPSTARCAAWLRWGAKSWPHACCATWRSESCWSWCQRYAACYLTDTWPAAQYGLF